MVRRYFCFAGYIADNGERGFSRTDVCARRPREVKMRADEI